MLPGSLRNCDAFVSKIANNNLCKEVCGLMWAPPIPHTILVARIGLGFRRLIGLGVQLTRMATERPTHLTQGHFTHETESP